MDSDRKYNCMDRNIGNEAFGIWIVAEIFSLKILPFKSKYKVLVIKYK